MAGVNPLDAFAAMVRVTADEAEAAVARLRESYERMRREIAFRSIPASAIRLAVFRDLASFEERLRAIADYCTRLRSRGEN